MKIHTLPRGRGSWFPHRLTLPIASFQAYKRNEYGQKIMLHHRNRSFFVFTDDVASWLDDNLAGAWTYPLCYRSKHDAIYATCVTFEVDEDMLAFQMKWL
jgi:hypothetical protein